jgi:hypothetical protein
MHLNVTCTFSVKKEPKLHTHAKDMTVNEINTNGLSWGKAGCDLSAGILGILVGKVTLEEAFPRVIPLSTLSINPFTFHPSITDAT